MGSDHKHEDGDECPECKFRKALAGDLDWAAGQSELEWDDLTGEVVESMLTALPALVRLRQERAIDDVDFSEYADMAAAAISRMAAAIQDLREHVTNDRDEAGAA